MSTHAAEVNVTPTDPVAFLRLFRRRTILAAILKNTFLAAFVNEVIRWAIVLSNMFWGTELPVLNVGPAFLVVVVMYEMRKLTRARTARRADRLFLLKDRLASWVDFSERTDLGDAIRDAQAGEVSHALAGINLSRGTRVRVWLIAGPVLLLTSIYYPDFYAGLTGAPPHRYVARRGGSTGNGRLTTGRPDFQGEPDGGHQKTPERGEIPVRNDGGEQLAGHGEESAPALQREDLPSLERRDIPPSTLDLHRNRSESGVRDVLRSKTVDSSVTGVVDPVFHPGTTSARRSEPGASGSISFRLLPQRPGRSLPREAVDAAPGHETVVVDLESVPQRFRLIVRDYFSYLGAVGSFRGATPPD